jgi:transcriptional antiterminator RfaH
MSWMVAVTQPRRESVAKRFVEAQGRETYFPLYRDFPCETIQPLFPNYLFIRHANDEAWHFLKSTIGIITFIMKDGQPELMRDSAMHTLRSYERDGVICLNEFHSGDKIKVVGSVFDGWNGIYLGMTSAGRCRIMLTMLGQEVPVTMEPQHVKAMVA